MEKHQDDPEAARRLLAAAFAAQGIEMPPLPKKAKIGEEEQANTQEEQQQQPSVAKEDTEVVATAARSETEDQEVPKQQKQQQHKEEEEEEEVVPAPLKKTIDVKLCDLNEAIVCELCAGYFINATAISECLHTFCRSCITQYLESADKPCCPTCGVVLPAANYMDTLLPDVTMQCIINRLVPNLKEEEERRHNAFLEAKGLLPRAATTSTASKSGDSASSSAGGGGGGGGGKEQPTTYRPRPTNNNDSYISFVLDLHKDDKNGAGGGEGGGAGAGAGAGAGGESGSSSDSRVRALKKPYIKTSPEATIQHLKKFVAKKLQVRHVTSRLVSRLSLYTCLM